MNQRTLWDYADAESAPEPEEEKERAERADRERSRRKTFKKLRASGHWLTLLRVARSIPQPFTLNDISVAVWKVCPEFFGMRGYPYPDNHKVHYILYGTRGLIAKGIIQRVRQGLFRIPDDVEIELEEATDHVEGPASAD
jgi:hypothetical protein